MTSSSSSVSSDSDIGGDRSDNDVTTPKVALNEENNLNHKLVEYHIFEAEIEKVKQTTKAQAQEISNLKKLLDKAIKDKEATSVELSSEVAILSSENENMKLLIETAKREEAELLNKIQSKESDVTTLWSEKQIIEEERDNLKILILDMEKEKEDLRNQLKDIVDKCNLLSSELEKAQQAEKEVQTLLEENKKIKNDNMMLLVEHDNLKAIHHNLDIEYCQLKDVIAETRAKNESLNKKNHSIERKLRQQGLEIDGLKVEVVQIMNNLDKERSTAMEEKERLVSEKSMYLNELEKTQSSVKDLEKELESTQNVLNSNITKLLKEKSSATSEIEQLEASLMNLKIELAQQLERISDMQKTNAGLELANSNLHDEIVEVQGQKNEAIASVIDLERKIEQQAQEISNLQEANKDLKTITTDMYNKVTTLQEEKNVALSQLRQSEANINNLQSDLEKLQNKNSRLQKQLEEIRTNLQGEITTLKEEKEDAVNTLQESYDEVHKNLCILTEQSQIVKVGLQQEVKVIQEEKDAVLRQLKQSEDSIRNLENEVLELKASLSAQLEKNSTSEKQLEEVKSSMGAEIAKLHIEKDSSLLELQTSQSFIKDLEMALQTQSKNISSLKQANDELQKKFFTLTNQSEKAKAELQQEVHATRKEKDAVLTQLKESEDLVQNLKNEVTRLKDEFSIQLENNYTLDKQLEEVRSSMSAEIAKLHVEKDASLLELQTSRSSTRDLEMAVQTQSDNISSLQQANDELQKKISTLVEQSEQAKTELRHEVKATNEEKDAVLEQLKQTEERVRNLENEVTQLQYELSVQLENNSTLDNQLEEVRRSMGAEITEIRTEKDASVLELQTSQSSVRDLEIALHAHVDNISTLQQANDELHKKICTLIEQLEQAKAYLQQEIMANDELQQENDELQKKFCTFTDQSEQAKAELQQEANATKEERDAVQTQLKKSEDLIQSLQNEVTRLKNELSIQSENNYTLDKQLEEVKSSMGAEIAKLHAQKDASLLELQTSRSSTRDLEMAVQTHTDNISSLQQANDELQKKIFTLVEQSEQVKTELEHEVKVTNEEKDAVLAQLKQTEERVQNLENEVTQLQYELSAQLENNSTLDNQLEEVRRSMGAEITKIRAEKDASLLELQTSHSSVMDLEIALHAHVDNISTLQQANDELHKKICTLMEQLEQAKAYLQQEIKANDELQQENDELQKKFCTFTDQSEQAKAELKQKVNATNEERDAVQTQLKKSKDLIQSLQNEVTRLKDELSIQSENNYTLDKQLEEVRSSMGDEIAKLHAEKDASLLELQTSRSSTRDLEMAVQTHSDNISSLQQANDELQKKISTLVKQSEQAKTELQHEVKVTNEEKDAVLAQLKQTEERVQNLENEVTQLKYELSVQLKNNSTLNMELEELKRSMGAEITKLCTERDASLLELQTSQSSVRDLEIALQTHNDNILTVQLLNDELQKKICTLTEQSEQARAELQQEVKATQEEKDATLTLLKQSVESVQSLENEVTRLQDELSIQLENNFTLNKQLEEVKNSAGGKIAELCVEKDASMLELQTSRDSFRDLEIAIQTYRKNTSTLRQANDELQKKIYTLAEQSGQAKIELQKEVRTTREDKDAVVTQLKLLAVKKLWKKLSKKLT